jgi:DNA-binding NarL/FixJ family response regulator
MTTSTERIRVLCADDHPLIREGVGALISTSDDLELAGEAASGQEAIDQFRALRPDVTLMDLQMPDMTGIDAIIAIRSECPDARIVMLTTYGGDALAQRVLQAGAKAYVLKSLVRKELLETIRAVHAGQMRFSPEIAASLAQHDRNATLSEREVMVLELIAVGNPNKLIARKLSISEETAKSHVKNILQKLGANDRTHAVSLGLERGILGWKERVS